MWKFPDKYNTVNPFLGAIIRTNKSDEYNACSNRGHYLQIIYIPGRKK